MAGALARQVGRCSLPLALWLAGAGCHSHGGTPPESVGSDARLPSAASSADVSASPAEDGWAHAEASPDTGSPQSLAASSNALGLDLYLATRGGHPSLALSPLAISMALTTIGAGARGDTEAQIEHVLHAQDSMEDTLAAEGHLLAWISDPAQTATLKIANRLFGDASYAFDPNYLARTRAAFGATLEPLDFVGAPDAARRTINDWIASQTAQHILDLIPPSGVTHETRLVLANAIYFLGLWDHPFKPEQTEPAPFHTSASSTRDVPTMHEEETLLYAHAGGVRVLQLPYAGQRLAMMFVLPDATSGLDAVEAGLSPATLDAWSSALAPTRVRVALPKFEISPTDPLALRAPLTALGMPLAFERGVADFTGIGASKRPDDRLFLDAIFHKAFVKVDESGTEATAATGASMKRPTFVRRDPPPEDFIADHPFLFFVRSVDTGMILFLGREGDPGNASSL